MAVGTYKIIEAKTFADLATAVQADIDANASQPLGGPIVLSAPPYNIHVAQAMTIDAVDPG